MNRSVFTLAGCLGGAAAIAILLDLTSPAYGVGGGCTNDVADVLQSCAPQLQNVYCDRANGNPGICVNISQVTVNQFNQYCIATNTNTSCVLDKNPDCWSDTNCKFDQPTGLCKPDLPTKQWFPNNVDNKVTVNCDGSS